MRTLSFHLLAFLAFAISAVADDQLSDGHPLVMVEVEASFIRATPDEIANALAASGATTNVLSTDQLAKALTSLKNSGAVVFGNPRAVTLSGQHGTAYAGKELPYPSQYATDKESGKTYPTSFERKNLGITFDFEPVVTTGGLIDIKLSPTVTNFLGFVDFSHPTPPKDSSLNGLLKNPLPEGGFWQPVFSEIRLSSQAALKSGQTILLGGVVEEISSPANLTTEQLKKTPDERLTYVFVTVRVLENS